MDLLLLMICHENSLTDSLYPILYITLKSGLKQAMEMLKLVGIKGSVLKNGKKQEGTPQGAEDRRRRPSLLIVLSRPYLQ